jgi:cold shock CspA family protein
MGRHKGIVKWSNNVKSSDLLGREEGSDLFVHFSSIQREGVKCPKMTKSFSASLTVKKILLLICIVGISFASLAQTNQTAWSNLCTLRPGQKIQVVETTSKKHSGLFASVSDIAISYRETTGEQSIQKQEVLSVKLMENKHRLRNTLIVAGAGASVGAAVGAAIYKPCSTSFCLDIGGRALPTGIARCSVAWAAQSWGSCCPLTAQFTT